jgi:hypothetical protein
MFCRSGMDPDDAWGGNAELRTDSRQLLGSKYSAPLSLSGSVMGHRGERMAAVSAAMQVCGGWGARRQGGGDSISKGVGACVYGFLQKPCLTFKAQGTGVSLRGPNPQSRPAKHTHKHIILPLPPVSQHDSLMLALLP